MDGETCTKSFYTVVRMQRKSDNSQTMSLVVDDTKHDSAKGIYSGWREHGHDIATPKAIPDLMTTSWLAWYINYMYN